MKANLIQTSICSIVYGTFQGKENQELFRCPRELDNTDLRNYVNKERIFLGVEKDDVEDLRKVPRKTFLGYYRMYSDGNGWFGRWLDVKDGTENIDVAGIEDITNWLRTEFPHGCDFTMKEYLTRFKNWGSDENRYLLRPIMSDRFKICIDTTYGNGDYPVRIYVYGD